MPMCHTCDRRPSLDGFTTCESCLREVMNPDLTPRKKDAVARWREHRQNAVDDGVCGTCYTNPLRTGTNNLGEKYRTCQACFDRISSNNAGRKKAAARGGM